MAALIANSLITHPTGGLPGSSEANAFKFSIIYSPKF